MKAVRIVVDKELLTATDKAARAAGKNRSELVREALREHLRQIEMRAREERDRKGYLKRPTAGKNAAWEAVAAWPAD